MTARLTAAERRRRELARVENKLRAESKARLERRLKSARERERRIVAGIRHLEKLRLKKALARARAAA